jgi:hypothetical protein
MSCVPEPQVVPVRSKTYTPSAVDGAVTTRFGPWIASDCPKEFPADVGIGIEAATDHEDPVGW